MGPSRTDTFTVTVMSHVVKQIWKLTLHSLTTKTRQLLYSWNQLMCVCVLSLWKILWSPWTWMFADCIHGNVLWKHSSCSAWHEIPGVWWGMLSRQRPPITHAPLSATLCTKLDSDRNRNTVKRVLGRLWSVTPTAIRCEGNRLCTHSGKRTCLMITWRLQIHGCLAPHSYELNEGCCDFFEKKRSHCVVWQMKLCIQAKVRSKIEPECCQ